LVDKLAINTCSKWLELHPLTQDYFEYLIYENKIVLAQAYDIVKEIIIDEKNIVDKVKFMSCSEWLQLHPRTQGCLQMLINEKKIASVQADYVVKKIIITEVDSQKNGIEILYYH
jgi:hypothetical protein